MLKAHEALVLARFGNSNPVSGFNLSGCCMWFELDTQD